MRWCGALESCLRLLMAQWKVAWLEIKELFLLPKLCHDFFLVWQVSLMSLMFSFFISPTKNSAKGRWGQVHYTWIMKKYRGYRTRLFWCIYIYFFFSFFRFPLFERIIEVEGETERSFIFLVPCQIAVMVRARQVETTRQELLLSVHVSLGTQRS